MSISQGESKYYTEVGSFLMYKIFKCYAQRSQGDYRLVFDIRGRWYDGQRRVRGVRGGDV
jgi:hypothetical protein